MTAYNQIPKIMLTKQGPKNGQRDHNVYDDTEDEDITTCNPFNMNSEMTIMQKIEREKGDTKCKDHLSEPRKY